MYIFVFKLDIITRNRINIILLIRLYVRKCLAQYTSISILIILFQKHIFIFIKNTLMLYMLLLIYFFDKRFNKTNRSVNHKHHLKIWVHMYNKREEKCKHLKFKNLISLTNRCWFCFISIKSLQSFSRNVILWEKKNLKID